MMDEASDTWQERLNSKRFGVTILFGSLMVILIIALVIITTTSTQAEKEQQSTEAFSQTEK